MMGQHVYIEPDVSTNDRPGIWLLEDYIIQDGKLPYVWAVSSGGRLERRTVDLGEYDDTDQCYEILDGLTAEDEIAWPEAGLRPGRKVTRGSFVDTVETEDELNDDLDEAEDTDTQNGDENQSSQDDQSSPEPSTEPSSDITPTVTPSPTVRPGASDSDIPEDDERHATTYTDISAETYFHHSVLKAV